MPHSSKKAKGAANEEHKDENRVNIYDIEKIYDEYLDKVGIEERKKIGRMPGFMSASSAGLCFLRHWFKLNNYESKPPDIKSKRTMRLGTLVHNEFEEAVKCTEKTENIEIKTEVPIKIEKPFKVRGYTDLVVINHNKKEITVIDYKTMHSFRWKRMFGISRNREKNPSNLSEIQLATYTIYFLQQYRDKGYIPQMYLVYYKKDDSSIKVVNIPDYFLNTALRYWEEASAFIEEIKTLDDAQPGLTYGVPMFEWECGKYCEFAGHCSSPYKKE